MKVLKGIAVISAVSMMLSSSAYAVNTDSNAAVGLKIGTLGYGVEARTAIFDNLFGRIGVNYLPLKMTFGSTSSDGSALQYKVKTQMLSVPLMLDWHPIDNSGFRVSVGVAYHERNLTANHEIKYANKGFYNRALDAFIIGQQGSTIRINGNVYNKPEIGLISMKVKSPSPIAGIVSIGYDSSLLNDDSFSFNAELGFIYKGKHKISIIAKDATESAKRDLDAKLKNNIKKKTNFRNIYPILSIGFKYAL